MSARRMREAAAERAEWRAAMHVKDSPSETTASLLASAIRSLPLPSPTDEDVERAAYALWLADAVRAAPNVAKMRTRKAFAEAGDEARKPWLIFARAAIAAYEEGGE